MKPSRFSYVTLLGFSSAAVLGGCASERTEAKDPSYETLKSQEVEAERQEFIQEKRQEISEVGQKIESLQSKVDQESDNVNERQRAEWRNVLFELEQERSRLNAELDRAESANEEEWKVMRGDIPVAVDSLQAGVTKLGNDVTNLFAEESPKVSADSGLCPVRVKDVDAEVATKSDMVIVALTTSDEKQVNELRQRALNLKKMKAYQPGRMLSQRVEPSDVSDNRGSAANGQRGSASKDPGDLDAKESDTATKEQRGKTAVGTSASDDKPSGSAGDQRTATTDQRPTVDAAQPIPVRRVSVENIDGGVRITFAVAADQKDRLSQRVSEDAERLESGDCDEGGSQQATVSSNGDSGSSGSGSPTAAAGTPGSGLPPANSASSPKK